MKPFIPIALLALMLTGCYSFSGASIPPNIKTFSLDHFPNRATLVNPTLSPDFTDKLRSYISSRSSLLEDAQENAHINITGEITAYTVTPMAAQSDAQAALQRLSVSIKVNFANKINEKESFSKTYTIFRDFDSSLDLSAVESGLVTEIIDEIVNLVFMDAFGNW